MSEPDNRAVLSEIARQLGGTVNAEGQGDAHCPVCDKPTFRFKIGRDGFLTVSCHSGACRVQSIERPNPTWLRRVQDDLVGQGVSRQWFRASVETSDAPPSNLPTEDELDEFTHHLLVDLSKDRFKDHPWLTPDVAVQADLGFDPAWDQGRGRLVCPVYDTVGTGALRTVIYRSLHGAKVKSRVHLGTRGRHLYAPNGLDHDEPVLLVGGEKDVIAALASGWANVACFTNGDGPPEDPARAAALDGLPVVIAGDVDAATKSAQLATFLLDIASDVRVADLSTHSALLPEKGDVADVLQHPQLGPAALRDLIVSASPWEATDGERSALSDAIANRVQALKADELARAQVRAERIAEREARSKHVRHMPGDQFFLDIPDSPEVLWGEGSRILWIDGEPLMICGDDGTGKSTIDHQLIAARLGLRDDLLGYPVAPTDGLVVYLAMDRPEQARRAGNRLFPPDVVADFRSTLESQLVVWRGPLPVDVLASPDSLPDWLHSEFGGIADLHIDSLKDVASRLNEDHVGAGINSALQEVVSRGINVVSLHHQRKANGSNGKPEYLSDVYGSRWLTAGQGSVLMLVKPGESGKDQVEMKQLKEPADRIPAMLVRHDRVNGRSHVVVASLSAEAVLDQYGEDGATSLQVAAGMFDKDARDVTEAEKKKAERVLTALVKQELVNKESARTGGKGGSRPARFYLSQGD